MLFGPRQTHIHIYMYCITPPLTVHFTMMCSVRYQPILEKWFPLQGERVHSLKFLKTPISIQVKSKSNTNPIHFFALSSFDSRANLSCVVATIFTNLAFLSSSVSMTNLSRLVAASFSGLALLSSSVYMANLSCFLATTFSSLRLLSNSLSSLRFHLLRVGRRCYSWFSVILFSRLILSISLLCSSITEALFALSFSFLSEHFFFVCAKVALAE